MNIEKEAIILYRLFKIITVIVFAIAIFLCGRMVYLKMIGVSFLENLLTTLSFFLILVAWYCLSCAMITYRIEQLVNALEDEEDE